MKFMVAAIRVLQLTDQSVAFRQLSANRQPCHYGLGAATRHHEVGIMSNRTEESVR
jgi:hypothetical protein